METLAGTLLTGQAATIVLYSSEMIETSARAIDVNVPRTSRGAAAAVFGAGDAEEEEAAAEGGGIESSIRSNTY